MLALGLAVALPTPSRPVVRAVLLEDPFGASTVPTLADVSVSREFDLTTTHTRWAEIAGQFYADVSGRITTLKPDIVIVRRADFHRSRSNADGPKIRLVIEGALSAAAIGHVANTHLRAGVECGRLYGKDKKDMDADAKTKVAKKDRAEAAAAGLSGLFANR
ncbi:MAG: hypothetical protein QM638_21510 [Nocardioides sp.]|uniref:hypothetical protein n=1 Tax=Nocardioides sp. TaxID=35761 RepID=UPI0039E67357